MDQEHLQFCRDGLSQLGIPFSQAQFEQLTRYIEEIELWNDTYKLVAAGGRELITKHILDSIAPLPLLKQRIEAADFTCPRIADAGSGAGLPGIPLAIMYPQARFTLIERSGRRCGFLHNAIAVCGLSESVTVIQKDVTEVKEVFDILTFRAFRPMPVIMKELSKLVLPGKGFYFAYKSQESSINQELFEVEQLFGGRWHAELIPVLVPGLEAERRICLLSENM